MQRTALFAAIVASWATLASAHPMGHGPILDEAAIRITASRAASYFVSNDVGREWGMLPKSWDSIPLAQTEILAEVDGYNVVAVRNLQENQVLYVLVTGAGEVVDANFSGTFPYVYDVQKDGRAEPD